MYFFAVVLVTSVIWLKETIRHKDTVLTADLIKKNCALEKTTTKTFHIWVYGCNFQYGCVLTVANLTSQVTFVCLFVCFVALRPKSTAMVIAGRSVHLTTLFPGQA